MIEPMSDNSTPDPKHVVRRWISEIVNESCLDAIDDVVATDFVEHALAPFGQVAPGPVDGPSHTRQTIKGLRTQFPDLQMTIDSLIGEGDLACARVTATGTNVGPINGAIPPTKKSFTVQQCHWFRACGGKLVEHWAVRDDLSSMLQLGVLSAGGDPR
jgi:predicted ester cyclase